MSLLQSIVGEVLKNAVQPQSQARQAPQNSQQGGLGGLLSGLTGAGQSNAASAGLGGLLGGVLGTQMGGRQAQGSALDSVLGGLLGGNKQNTSAGDLGNILGTVLGGGNVKSAGMNKSALLLALLPVVLAFIQKNGGLSGVLGKFSNSGLQNKAQSWVNIDTNNDGIDADDIARLFDNQEIEQICKQTGASQSEVCQGIAELLPKVVDDLTPQGDLSSEKEANDEIAELLAKMKAAQ
ncbi:YidB family protein [Moraxella canis]|uniref:YidB family protein n=1 Tax=Moraxella canis TaxID=90239 RepID=A0ABZ0WXK1_9GAMM|nr:YidB family protein [Moraxella canis]WQE03758.1 YidB family protein [Moraxella canis]